VKCVRPLVCREKQRKKEREGENRKLQHSLSLHSHYLNEQQILRFEVERAGWGTPQEE